MVRALLDGSKTQTRREIRPQPTGTMPAGWRFERLGVEGWHATDGTYRGEGLGRCPYGVPGDQLWIREAHAIGPGTGIALFHREDGGALRFPYVTYTADGAVERRDTRWSGVFGKRRPSIHMPRCASRITLEVTDVRVERLQDISRGDAMAEGCPFPNMAQGDDPREWYRDLWDTINGAGSWDANPWVWVVGFRRLP